MFTFLISTPSWFSCLVVYLPNLDSLHLCLVCPSVLKSRDSPSVFVRSFVLTLCSCSCFEVFVLVLASKPVFLSLLLSLCSCSYLQVCFRSCVYPACHVMFLTLGLVPYMLHLRFLRSHLDSVFLFCSSLSLGFGLFCTFYHFFSLNNMTHHWFFNSQQRTMNKRLLI